MVVSFPEQPSSLHVLSSSMFAASFYASRVNDDDVHRGPKVIFDDKDIHPSLGVAKKKVGGFLLNMCSTFQNNNPIMYGGLL
jgi:hypothetical protein